METWLPEYEKQYVLLREQYVRNPMSLINRLGIHFSRYPPSGEPFLSILNVSFQTTNNVHSKITYHTFHSKNDLKKLLMAPIPVSM